MVNASKQHLVSHRFEQRFSGGSIPRSRRTSPGRSSPSSGPDKRRDKGTRKWDTGSEAGRILHFHFSASPPDPLSPRSETLDIFRQYQTPADTQQLTLQQNVPNIIKIVNTDRWDISTNLRGRSPGNKEGYRSVVSQSLGDYVFLSI